MRYGDEARTIRHRHDGLVDDCGRFGPDQSEGPPVRLFRTVTVTTYPTTAGAAYAAVPVTPSSSEAEGAAPTLTAGTDRVFAVNLGTLVPPSGTNVLAILIDGLWIFQYG